MDNQNAFNFFYIKNKYLRNLNYSNMRFSKYLNFVRDAHENGFSEKTYKMISQQLTRRPII